MALMTGFNLEKTVMLFLFFLLLLLYYFPSYPSLKRTRDIKSCLVIYHCSKRDEETWAWGATKSTGRQFHRGPLQITYTFQPIPLPSSSPPYRTMALSLDAFLSPLLSLLLATHFLFPSRNLHLCSGRSVWLADYGIIMLVLGFMFFLELWLPHLSISPKQVTIL